MTRITKIAVFWLALQMLPILSVAASADPTRPDPCRASAFQSCVVRPVALQGDSRDWAKSKSLGFRVADSCRSYCKIVYDHCVQVGNSGCYRNYSVCLDAC